MTQKTHERPQFFIFMRFIQLPFVLVRIHPLEYSFIIMLLSIYVTLRALLRSLFSRFLWICSGFFFCMRRARVTCEYRECIWRKCDESHSTSPISCWANASLHFFSILKWKSECFVRSWCYKTLLLHCCSMWIWYLVQWTYPWHWSDSSCLVIVFLPFYWLNWFQFTVSIQT